MLSKNAKSLNVSLFRALRIDFQRTHAFLWRNHSCGTDVVNNMFEVCIALTYIATYIGLLNGVLKTTNYNVQVQVNNHC